MSMNRSPLTAMVAVLMVASLVPVRVLPAEPTAAPATLASPGAPATLAPPQVTNVPFERVVDGDQGADRAWVNAEYLLWWMRGPSLPSLATTNPTGTGIASAGILGNSTTTTIFGGSTVNDAVRSGGRVSAGTWFGDGQMFGVEAYFLMLESKATNFAATSDGSTILARPFLNANTDTTAAVRVAFPGEFTGSIASQATTTGLIGTGFLLRSNLLCGGDYRVDILGGYRYLRFADRLGVVQDQTALAGNPDLLVPGTHITAADQFATRNDFHGIDLGLAGEFHRGPFTLNLLGKLAVGYTQQDVDISGSTNVEVPGMPGFNSPGGLLALSNNIGHHSRGNEISVIPEFEAKLGYQITQRLKATLGYSIIYWDNVVRAGDQVDRLVNPNLLPNSGVTGGAPNPVFQFNRNNLWIQGLEVGLEYRF
jgi:hypothetical protein